MAKIKKKKKSAGRPKISKRESLEKYFAVFNESERVQIDYMLQTDSTYPEIIDTIKNHFEKLQDAGNVYLTNRLISYKKHILEPKLITQIEDVNVYKELLSLKGKVDSMKEFTNLVLSQKKRMERALTIEMVGGRVEKFARQEIKLMADILEKLAKLQLETGALARAPRVLTGTFEEDDDDPSKKTYTITESFMKALDDLEVQFTDITPEPAQITHDEDD